MLIALIFVLSLLPTSHGFASIRGYSTVWRNHKDEIVKRVVYADSRTRLAPSFSNEIVSLNQIPKHWEYEAFAVAEVQKLVIRPTRRL
jgi:hypothetical protein